MPAPGLTWAQGPTPDEIAFPVLKASLAAGANVWNGADFYGTPDCNSLHLLARYFTAYPEDADKVVLCIKSGVADMKAFRMDSSPAFLRAAVDKCNAILDGKKKIDIFGAGRVDPNVPIEETVKALGEMVDEGKIGGIQLSEVAADTIRRAYKIYKIAMVEAEVSLWATEVFDNGVSDTCKELGIVLCGHTPLGAGILTGQIKSINDMPANDHHRSFPRFQPENFDKNLELVKEVEKLAKEKTCTTAQLALSWIKAKGVVPVAGARNVERVKENCTAVELRESDLETINGILRSFPVQGTRYPQFAMKYVEY